MSNTNKKLNLRKESSRIAWMAREADDKAHKDVENIISEIEDLVQIHTNTALQELKENVEGMSARQTFDDVQAFKQNVIKAVEDMQDE